jgi:hypothetical protein
MQQHGIRARGKRRFRVVTTDSRHDLPIAPNLLNRNFSPGRAQPGVVRRHHVYRHRGRLVVSGGGDRPVQPQCGGLVDAA